MGEEHDGLCDPDSAAGEGVGFRGGEAVLGDRRIDDRAPLEGVDGGDQREDQDEYDREHDAALATRGVQTIDRRPARHDAQPSDARAAIAG